MAKTGYSRAERVADQIRMEVADILMRRIKDPRVRSVTVTDVELTNDLRIARVFVTALGTEAETKDVSGPRGDRVLRLLDEIQDKGHGQSDEHDDAPSSHHG
jgi:ribosome-binding factor A